MRVGFEVPERWAGRDRPGPAITATRGAAGLGVLRPHHRHRQPRRRDDAHAAPGGRARQSTARRPEDRHGDHRRARIRQPTSSSPCRGSRCNGTAAARSSGRWWTARRAAPTSRSSGGESGIVMVQGELAAGDKVVVEGMQRLREGAKVAEVGASPTIVEDERGAGRAAGGAPRRSAAPAKPARRGAEAMARHSKTHAPGSARRPRASPRSACAARC